MRLHVVLTAVMSAVVAGATVLAASPAATASATPAATHKVIVRPVTSSGHVASGFHVRGEPTGSVDCSTRSPSPGAVSRNIEACSPSAEYAVACWKAAARHRVLCMRNPASRTVYRIHRVGGFKATGRPPAAQRAPLRIVLSDGDNCSIRDGGAGGTLSGHPTFVATYYCAKDGAVWAPFNAKHGGIDTSAPAWTVRTARAKQQKLTRHVVRKAYFVGTA